jgi:uncharacterized protein (UPF0332 family)
MSSLYSGIFTGKGSIYMQRNLKELCKYRFEQARKALESSKHNIDFDLKTSLNRSYYAIMYAAKALLALDRLDAHSHKGIFVVFNKEFIKTGIFDKEFLDILKQASMIREKSDYKDFYIVSKDEAKQQIENAEKYLSKIAGYIESKLDIRLEDRPRKADEKPKEMSKTMKKEGETIEKISTYTGLSKEEIEKL